MHVAGPEEQRGVVCDVDDTVWITGLRHPLRAAWRTLARSSSGRTMVPGMAGLLTRLVADHPNAPVVYLSNGPWNLAGPVARFLHRNRFPAGALLMTDWGITPRGWFRDGRAHKRGALERLAADLPGTRWVLVGDDGEHDPQLYHEFADRHPDRVEAIALRQVQPTGDDGTAEGPGGVPVSAPRTGPGWPPTWMARSTCPRRPGRGGGLVPHRRRAGQRRHPAAGVDRRQRRPAHRPRPHLPPRPGRRAGRGRAR
ncbi:hypothetical protein A7K94_0208025 [Modestobacter sp. VKM Ac-2676]|nr:hypothetical protein A7K94_0208025 [Modestobacter sp. VKM Ac-2676]